MTDSCLVAFSVAVVLVVVSWRASEQGVGGDGGHRPRRCSEQWGCGTVGCGVGAWGWAWGAQRFFPSLMNEVFTGPTAVFIASYVKHGVGLTGRKCVAKNLYYKPQLVAVGLRSAFRNSSSAEHLQGCSWGCCCPSCSSCSCC